MRRVALLACVGLVGCGSRGDTAPQATRDDAAPPRDAPPVAELEPRALGMPDLAAFQWRTRGGHPAYRIARKAEAAGDWAIVVTTCRQALAADPGHLEAAWLLAVGLGKLAKPDELLAPLHTCAAGDFGKWGPASLELPSLQPFLATPAGQAWRRRVEHDRAAYGAALVRALIVTSRGDLYGFDADQPRWYRITRTYGAVIGALRVPAANKLVYVTRQRVNGKHDITLAVGIVDLARGKTSIPTALGTKGPISVAYSTRPGGGAWIGAGAPRATAWRKLDEDGKLTPLPPKTARPPGPWLEVHRRARLHAIPVADVIADFDDSGLASAIRIGTSNRVVSMPSPALIDGNSAIWSTSRSQLAFVAQLDDQCTPGALNAAAFVADASTGALRELERGAGGLAIAWLSDRKLAIAGDHGVRIIDLDGGDPRPLEGADHLLIARQRPKCTPAEPDDAMVPDEPEAPDPAAVRPSDARVVEPP